jgi:hypothetical protein
MVIDTETAPGGGTCVQVCHTTVVEPQYQRRRIALPSPMKHDIPPAVGVLPKNALAFVAYDSLATIRQRFWRRVMTAMLWPWRTPSLLRVKIYSC